MTAVREYGFTHTEEPVIGKAKSLHEGVEGPHKRGWIVLIQEGREVARSTDPVCTGCGKRWPCDESEEES